MHFCLQGVKGKARAYLVQKAELLPGPGIQDLHLKENTSFFRFLMGFYGASGKK